MAKHNIYFMANYIAKPKNAQLTAQKGYMSNPANMQLEEQVFIAQGWREKFMRCNVVLDLTEQKVIKNSMSPGTPYAEVYAEFYKNYSEYIDDSVNTLNAATGLIDSV